MIDAKNPSEIARKALKQLANAHLPPTPANFQAAYNEIAQLPNVAAFPEVPLRQILAELPSRSQAQAEALADMQTAIANRTWQGVQNALLRYIDSTRTTPAASAAPLASLASDLPPLFAGQLAALLEDVLPALDTGGTSRLADHAEGLLHRLQQPPVEIAPTCEQLIVAAPHFRYAAGVQVEIRQAMFELLHLLIENIGELVIEDSWLKGQVDCVLNAMQLPMNLRHLDEAKQRLRDVIAKQHQARQGSLAVREEMRQMLDSFIERLASMNESSDTFRDSLESMASKMEGVESLDQLLPLVGELIGTTRQMASQAAQTGEHLHDLQGRVRDAEAKLVQLHIELDTASAQARHDPLTDALNRKGLDEALQREISRMRRLGGDMALCMLDIDNFKKLNDRLGHQAGDEALVHLAEVARACMRPTDSLARYGGEEFVILMPDTTQAQGIDVITRLQRELTRRFYLADKERVLITFSAGVVVLGEDENGEDAICRADAAMYLAKRSGKNRVFGA